ncbi:hypothetical protein EJ04DRAFT_449134 [Polyplosphaeria fusca]|uniref:Chitin-binding type-1 domain-containing protein n=1 Tax=Polyplosphaeria fusca TaxID=682080 RepID=A0A9P4QPC3_9PLEO|nr:hypothetical protein EJ04DRAFT_449134 [Polyplosphaeria fusca]
MHSFFIILLAVLSLTTALTTSRRARQCGAQVGLNCSGNIHGPCCSSHGYCGSSSAYCGAGCQSGFGSCDVAETASNVSTDGRCGGPSRLTCLGSTFGSCCSPHGRCGSSTAHCGTGCNSEFGTCRLASLAVVSSSTVTTSSVPAPSAPAPSASMKVSEDTRCGPKFGGQTCQGSEWGPCCSTWSYCGRTRDHCETGCQAGFGIRFPDPSTTLLVSALSSSMESSTSSLSQSTLSGPSTLLSVISSTWTSSDQAS